MRRRFSSPLKLCARAERVLTLAQYTPLLVPSPRLDVRLRPRPSPRPSFRSYTETDPVSISLQGVQKFRAERFDVIIVDTSGRHRQESELFDEMCQIQDAVEPDMTVLVLDGAIGQAAEAQSEAFKEASNFGAIIVTKLDGHAKGGGAISACVPCLARASPSSSVSPSPSGSLSTDACPSPSCTCSVAATRTPIIFIGTGEHLHDLEKFAPRPFISKMLGMGDMQGLVERAQEMAMANPERQENMMKKLEKGEFTVRDLKEQMQTIMNMCVLSSRSLARSRSPLSVLESDAPRTLAGARCRT